MICVSFSPDGSKFACGWYRDSDTVQIYNVAEGKVETELIGHRSQVSSVAFSQNGCRIVSGSGDGTVRIWNSVTGEAEVELTGHSGVRSVAFSQDGCQVVSGSDDKTVRIWNSKTGELEAKLVGHMQSVELVAFTLDGRVISGSYDTVRIWNSMTSEAEAESDMLKGLVKAPMDGYAFSQDGTLVVYANESYKRLLRIWNTLTGEVETNLEEGLDSVQPEVSVTFSQDSSRAVSGLRDAIKICNTKTGKVEAVLKGHAAYVDCVASSQNGSQVVSGASDSTLRIWNTTI